MVSKIDILNAQMGILAQNAHINSENKRSQMSQSIFAVFLYVKIGSVCVTELSEDELGAHSYSRIRNWQIHKPVSDRMGYRPKIKWYKDYIGWN